MAFYHWKSYFWEKSLSVPRGETKCVMAHSLYHWNIGEILICKTININSVFCHFPSFYRLNEIMQTPWWNEDSMKNWKRSGNPKWKKNVLSFNLFEVFSSSHCPAAVQESPSRNNYKGWWRETGKCQLLSPDPALWVATSTWKTSKNGEILTVVAPNESPTTASAQILTRGNPQDRLHTATVSTGAETAGSVTL